jgi:hypothetical protein
MVRWEVRGGVFFFFFFFFSQSAHPTPPCHLSIRLTRTGIIVSNTVTPIFSFSKNIIISPPFTQVNDATLAAIDADDAWRAWVAESRAARHAARTEARAAILAAELDCPTLTEMRAAKKPAKKPAKRGKGKGKGKGKASAKASAKVEDAPSFDAAAAAAASPSTAGDPEPMDTSNDGDTGSSGCADVVMGTEIAAPKPKPSVMALH